MFKLHFNHNVCNYMNYNLNNYEVSMSRNVEVTITVILLNNVRRH